MSALVAETDKVEELSQGLLDFVEKWRDKPGNLIMILHRAQHEYGYVPRQVAIRLSQVMGVPLAKIYGVLTFYHYFKLKKPGKYRLAVCMGTACYLKGGQDLIQELENLLGMGINQTSDDGLFSIEAVRCVGCCGLAPLLVVNEEVYGKLEGERLPEILAEYRNKG